jgi:hypothetical protein
MTRTLKLITCAAIAMLVASCTPREDEAIDTALIDTAGAMTTTPGATAAPAPTDTPRSPARNGPQQRSRRTGTSVY